MMNTRVKAALLALLSVAQLTAAGWSIARYESTLRSGALYRIRIEPVDPADAFRGRYVAIRPSITVPAPVDAETKQLLDRIERREEGYVVLANDDDGFARISQVLMAPPDKGDYLKVAYAWEQLARQAQGDQPGTPGGYIVQFSFDRYYMNEGAAPAAEQRFWEATRRNSASRAWLAVRVKDGVGVIESLFIDGVELR
jgi:uncharacterized membrane-anchored protein